MDQLLFEKNPISMLIYDLDSLKILKVNRAFTEKYKYRFVEIERREVSLKDIHPEEAIPKLTESINHLESGDAINDSGVHRHLSKEGDLFYMRITSQSYPFNDHNARLVASYDITEQIEMKQRSAAAYEELQHHITNSPLASVKWDPEFKLMEWSSRAEHISGYAASEVRGESLFALDIFDEAEKSMLKTRVQAMINGALDRDQFETMITRKGGGRLHIRIHTSALRDSEGKLKSVLTLIEDITTQKESEIKLKESLEEKQLLLAEIHHRVKNNLAVISGLIQLQAFDSEDKNIKKALGDSQLRIKSIAIVHELLYQSESFSDISLQTYIKQLLSEISGILSIDTENIDIKTDIEDISININQAIPCAMLINELVNNAYKHAFKDNKGTIYISVTQAKGQVKVRVRDDGRGLPGGLNEHEEENSSLGLTLIETLAQQLEADLSYHNDDGAVFNCSFEAA